MGGILFDTQKLKVKLFITFIIVAVFMVLYKTLPVEELGKEGKLSSFDLFYYTVLAQLRVIDNKLINPTSFRAKMLTMMQLILGYSIIIL